MLSLNIKLVPEYPDLVEENNQVLSENYRHLYSIESLTKELNEF